MTKKSGVFITRTFTAGILLTAFFGLTGADTARADGAVPRRILVHVNTDAAHNAATRAREIERDFQVVAEPSVNSDNLYTLHLRSTANQNQMLTSLSGDSRVAWAEYDTYLAAPEVIPSPALPDVIADPFHFPFDRSAGAGKYLKQIAYTQINLGQAVSLTAGQGIIVAVLDTGVVANHTALQTHLVAGYNVLTPGTSAEDIADGTSNASVGHGTMVAGLIAAIAPGAKILPVRVLNGDGVGTASGVAQGIEYAIAHGAKVINLSLSSATFSHTLADAIHHAAESGVLVVAAAGNGGDTQTVYPAALPEVMAVSSVEADGTKSDYANYAPYVAVVAPGSDIHSTYADGAYAGGSGTSFAAPFVSAEAALIFALQSSLPAPAVRDHIRMTAHSVDSLNPQYAHRLGSGLIDIARSVLPSGPFSSCHDPNDPPNSGHGPHDPPDYGHDRHFLLRLLRLLPHR